MSVASQGAGGPVKTSVHVAQESYERCLRAPDFFAHLYERLLASDPVIPSMFARTEFPRQHRLLQHGLGLLLIYAKRADRELLDRIAARHSSSGLDVNPSLYPHFVSSLISAVRHCDPRCSEEIEQAWREAVRPGLEFMASRYEA